MMNAKKQNMARLKIKSEEDVQDNGMGWWKCEIRNVLKSVVWSLDKFE